MFLEILEVKAEEKGFGLRYAYEKKKNGYG